VNSVRSALVSAALRRTLELDIGYYRAIARRLEEQVQLWRDLAAEPGISEQLRTGRLQYADYDQERAAIHRQRQRALERELAELDAREAQA
jgi:hypothetical protein